MSIEILEEYAETLKEKFSISSTAQPEATLRPVVRDLVRSIGISFDYDIEMLDEINLNEQHVRPDIGVFVNRLLCGFIELKAPGRGANPSEFKGIHDKEQWNKLKCLPNLIYTDGRDWALYRNGNLIEEHSIIRFKEDPFLIGKASVNSEQLYNFKRLFRDFFNWEPIVPIEPTALANFIAPIANFLRTEVEMKLTESTSAISALANEWRSYFFHDADSSQFADAYTQTVTYALLLARLSGAVSLDPRSAADALDRKNNGLLARTLEILSQDEAQKEILIGYNVLRRTLEALDPVIFKNSGSDLWLYFYEEFLKAYNPKLRMDLGVFYTPKEVVKVQVNLASEILDTHFGKDLGFADDGVMFIDPAVGTGTYLVEAVNHGLKKVIEKSGIEAVPARANLLAKNMHGFEILVGPYAVAHLRLTQIIEDALNQNTENNSNEKELKERLKIFLADTLESPLPRPPGVLQPLIYRVLTKEHESARKLKNEGNILVCIGNPPYKRESNEVPDEMSRRKGGWVRHSEEQKSQEAPEDSRPILNDFSDPLTEPNERVHLKNLYNDYVYFWRWALWRLFDQQENGGIVSYISASSYLFGPGFAGMREFMRRTFDKLWIIDLQGGNLGTRKTANVFKIQIPVAIAVGVRGKKSTPNLPAEVQYAKVEAPTRESKLLKLSEIVKFSDLDWSLCQNGWKDPFLPESKGRYFEWPELTDLFPWQHSGSQFKRTWPIAETKSLLEKRWNKFCESEVEERKTLFKESRDRKIEKQYVGFDGKKQKILSSYEIGSPIPIITKYGYRFLDRRFAIFDHRFGDYLRPQLLQVYGDNNIFFVSLTNDPIDNGPAITATIDVPDIHFPYAGGNKDILPLFRDSDCSEANITEGILSILEYTYGVTVSPQDFGAYVYAILGQPYVTKFWDELEIPVARVPITKDKDIFNEVCFVGKKLLFLHTFGERFSDCGFEIPKGESYIKKGIPHEEHSYPNYLSYNFDTCEISIGDGIIGKVDPEVWNFKVSDKKVVDSWIKYRLKKRIGKISSPLDKMRPESWLPGMTDELLDVLWIIEATIAIHPILENKLDRVISNQCFSKSELPVPTEREREAPEKLFPGIEQFELSFENMTD